MTTTALSDLSGILQAGVDAGASDWQFCDGEPVSVRVHGRMQILREAPVMGAGEARRLAIAALAPAADVPPGRDGSFRCGGQSYRLHSFTAGGGRYCFTLRRLAETIPELASLGVPAAFAQTALAAQRGLILVSGPTGSGKSTTLAAAVHRINQDRGALILTLEDPVEFRHVPARSVVRQLEKGADFRDFAEALHGALRADPDVILLGEMRDRETMSAALSAAETGHLVLATLHASSAAAAVARITGAFPASHAAEIRAQLAQQLVAVLAQQLVRSPAGPAVAAYELLLGTPGVKRLIQDPERRGTLLENEIGTGRAHGMVAMDQSLEDLYRRRAIPRAEALRAAFHPQILAAALKAA